MPDDARPAGGSPAPAEHELLTRLGKYVIERKLGSGGMGTVFLAKDSDLKRTVALKVLSKDKAENPVLVRRFKAEGQAAAYLQHKNIVGVYDSGQIDGFLYIALEYVEGQDVLDIIRKRGVIPVKRSIEIIKQVAEALDHAYEKQIVHRDIKPSNLLIKNDGTVKLADLGLARSIDETLDTSITRVGTTVGTVDYMSPEQARNSKATDIRSDIYSLGCTWYHMLTGVPPYGEGSVTNKLQAHATAPLPDPRSRNERIPEGVVAVLHRMIAKQAKDRYQTPAELLEDLNNPGIVRSGLNADVLAALAAPGTRPPESSSGDIFEPRVPLDSVELDAAVSTLRQDALPTGVVFDEETEDGDRGDDDRESDRPPGSKRRIKPGPQKESPRGKAAPREEPDEDDDNDRAAGSRPRNKSGSEKESPRGKAPPREERGEEPDVSRSASARSAKSKASSGDPGKSGPLPRRQSETERDAQANVTDSAKHRFKQRKLPPRSSDTPLAAEPVKMSLDPDRIRAIVLGGIVLAVLAGLGFALSRMVGSGKEPDTGPGNLAAALQQRQPEQQPAAVPQEPSVPPGEQGSQKKAPVAGEPNDSSTALRKAAEPIAGAEDFTDLNSKPAREYVPNWLFQVRQPLAAEAKTVVVRRPGTPGDGFATVAEALAKLPGGPVVVEFRGDGPFVIPPGKLPSHPQLVLKGANGSRPVLVFNPADLKPGDTCLSAEGPVTFRGLHLVLATSGDTPAGVAMIEGASVSMRDCTLQSVGAGARGTSLIRIAGATRDASGAVFENCHLRSKEGDGLRLEGANGRVLAGNTLFCFENGAAVSVAAASGSAGQGREVTLLRSTMLGGRTGAVLTHEGSEPPAPVSFVLRKSNWSAVAPEATLLVLKGWPVSDEGLTEKPTAIGASWKSELASLEGWHTFARMSSAKSGKESAFEGDSGWQKFWRQSQAGTRLIERLPEAPADVASQDAAALVSLGSSRETEPGCKIAGLPSTPSELIERVRILATARRLPADFIAFRKPTNTSVLEYEIKPGGSLNALLNDSSKCPEGALIRLTGAGLKTLPAIVVQNRTLHIEFVQTDKAPLTIRPQPNLDVPAFITVQGGNVSITGARFLLPESDRQTYPSSLIEAAGGNLALSNCTLTGPVEESTRLGPLIRWTPGDGTEGMLIRDSMLTGGRSAVEADLTGRMLDVENSILAASGDSLSLTIHDATRPGDILIKSSTLGAARSILNVTALPQGDSRALIVRLRDSVVLGTAGAREKVSMLMAPAREDVSRIVWWEDGVGYSADSAAAVELQSGALDPGSWIDRWGAGHVLRMCSSELAVLFEKPLESLAKPDLAMFRLNPGSLAATWSSTGGPLGATGGDIGAPTEMASPPAKDAGSPKTPQAPPQRPRSVF